jgi:signal transduction histidine kinase
MRFLLDLLQPKSKDPNEAFRERLIRFCAALALLIDIVAFFLEISRAGLVFAIVLHLLIAAVILLIVLLIQKRYIILAGQVMVSLTIIGQSVSTFQSHFNQGTVALTISPISFSLALVFATLCLPQNQIIPFTFITILAFLCSMFLPQMPLWIENFNPYVFCSVAVCTLLLEGFMLNQMAIEASRRYREAEKANQVKTEFLRLVNHELRTPLTSIVPLLDLFLMRNAWKLDGKQEEYIKRIKNNANHLNNLISNILNFSKLDAGGININRERVDIDNLIERAVANLHPKSGVVFYQEMRSNLCVELDPDFFAEAILNVLSNAIKFTDSGYIAIRSSAVNGLVRIEIEDTGCGISDESLVFREFAQTVEGRARGGTGLGMPIAKKLIELHGGKIYFVSTIGKGTTFTIELKGAL